MEGNHSDLLKRLEAYDLANLGGDDCFLIRLTKEQQWTPEFARRVIDEYRRFLFLSATAPHVVSPSAAVDEVWHLHLIHTTEYWTRFCPQVLGRDLHHTPATEAQDDKLRHFEWYAQTIESYQSTFGSLPPRDIWPAVHEGGRMRKGLSPALCATILGLVFALLFLLLLRDPAHALTPLDALNLKGPDFMELQIELLLGAGLASLVILLLIYAMSAGSAVRQPDLTPVELGLLRDSNRGAVLSAIADLQSKELIAADTSGGLEVKDMSVKGLDPITATTLQVLARGSSLRKDASLRDICDQAAERLAARGFMLPRLERRIAQLSPFLLMGAVELFGLCKIWIGMDRGRPVFNLSILTFMAAIVMLVLYAKAPRLSRAGRAVLREMRQRYERLDVAPRRHEIALAAALFGASALTATPLAAYVRREMTSGTGCSGASCSSSCSGGSGGGGGCGGCGGD